MPDPDLGKTQQDVQLPRLSWYEQRRPPVGDDKSTTITLNWGKVGPAIGLLVFIGGIVTTAVNTAVSVSQYKAKIEEQARDIDILGRRVERLESKVTGMPALRMSLDDAQRRLAAVEVQGAAPLDTVPATETRYVRQPRPRDAAAGRTTATAPVPP